MPESAKKSPVQALDKLPVKSEELVALVSDSYQHLSVNRYHLEYAIREAKEFLQGNQWISFNPTQGTFGPHKLEDWVPTPVTNLLIEVYDRLLDLFLSGDLIAEALPTGQGQAAVEAAQAASRILSSEQERNQTHERIYKRSAGWLLVAGTAFIYRGWNPLSGTKVDVPQMKLDQIPVTRAIAACNSCGQKGPVQQAGIACPACGRQMSTENVNELTPEGRPVLRSRQRQKKDKDGNLLFSKLSMGDIEEAVISPLNFFPSAGETMESVRYCIEEAILDLDTVKDLFGTKARDVIADDLTMDGEHHTSQFTFSQHGPEDRTSSPDQVKLKLFRHRPDRRFKDGAFLITANDKHLLHEDKKGLRDTDGELPYQRLVYREIPGSFWGASALKDLLPAQKRVNSIDSHLVSNRKKMISNQILTPTGSGIKRSTGKPGAIVYWNPATSGGFKPEILPGVPLPSQVYEERNTAAAEMKNSLAGVADILSGGTPNARIESGPALELAREEALARFGPMVRSVRTQWSQHEKGKLILFSKHWSKNRLVQVMGENAATQTYYYSKADIRGATTMRVGFGGAIMFSRQEKERRLLQAIQLGLVGDINRPEVRGRLMEKLGVEGFEAEYSLDAKKARRVLLHLIEGSTPPEQSPFDNHAVQFAILREYMMTVEFESLSSEVQGAIAQRAQVHQQAVQQEQQQALQAAQAARGSTPEISQAVEQTGALGGTSNAGVSQ